MLSPSLGTAIKTMILSFLAGIIIGVMFAGTLSSFLIFIQVGFAFIAGLVILFSIYRFVKGRRSSNEKTEEEKVMDEISS